MRSRKYRVLLFIEIKLDVLEIANCDTKEDLRPALRLHTRVRSRRGGKDDAINKGRAWMRHRSIPCPFFVFYIDYYYFIQLNSFKSLTEIKEQRDKRLLKTHTHWTGGLMAMMTANNQNSIETQTSAQFDAPSRCPWVFLGLGEAGVSEMDTSPNRFAGSTLASFSCSWIALPGSSPSHKGFIFF